MRFILLFTFLISKAYCQSTYIEKSSFDTSISPGDNFFHYVNGGWLKKPDFPSKEWKGEWGGHLTAQYKSDRKLNIMLDSLSRKNFPPNSAEQKVSDFIKSYMDSVSVNKASYNPLKPLFKKIDAAQTFRDLLPLIGEMVRENGDRLLGFMVWPDDRNSEVTIPKFTQAGLTFFVSTINYTRTDSIGERNRSALVRLAADYFVAMGIDKQKALTHGHAILELEKKLHLSWRSGLQLNDPALNYNKLSIADAQKLAPNLNWFDLLKAMDIKTDSINIAQPNYFQTLSELLKSEPLEVWKAKIKFDYLYRIAYHLSSDFREGKSKFLATIRGLPYKPLNRADAIADYAMLYLKDLTGQLYVKAYMDVRAKTAIKNMAENIRQTFAERIRELPWMSEKTKQYALHKLSSMIINVGNPDKWDSYDDVQFKKDDFYHNVRSIALHDYNKTIAMIDKPHDRREWILTPMYVGAQSNWALNSITLPAGLMQFPYFDLSADDAVNYGGIGSVIAHEMTHGFDDLGRKYGAKGGLFNWWQPHDEAAFQSRAKKMIDQYAGYIVFDSLRINSPLMLNENLADLGGVTLAYEAFKKTKQGKSSKPIDGFTPDQRFFISYAIKNRRLEIITPNNKNTLQTGLHAPYKLRVNGPFSNFQPFYNAFKVTEKHKMYRSKEQRVSIW